MLSLTPNSTYSKQGMGWIGVLILSVVIPIANMKDISPDPHSWTALERQKKKQTKDKKDLPPCIDKPDSGNPSNTFLMCQVVHWNALKMCHLTIQVWTIRLGCQEKNVAMFYNVNHILVYPHSRRIIIIFREYSQTEVPLEKVKCFSQVDEHQ